MCGILLSAVILLLLVKLVARDDAEPEFWPMAGVALVVTLAGLAGRLLLTDVLGPSAGLLGIPVLAPALVYACEISWKQAIIVTVLYVVVIVGLTFGLALLLVAA